MSGQAQSDIILERFEAMACTRCKETLNTQAIEPFTVFACPHCGEQLRMPARFANFILLEEFGKGGMGAVYRAFDQTLGRSVAIKVTQREIAKDRAFVEQFLQEARALAAINHPNIVQIYNYGEENGQPYIVMELVDGGRLDHIQAQKKVLDELFVLKVARQVIMGLDAAAQSGMTHGDIKPANILFDRAGNAKVADFGLARFAGQKPKPGEIWGTPFYVAPEVVRGNAPRSPADIYSLGATMYHLITGEPPFNGETVTDTVLLRFKEPAPDPREFKKEVSPKTAALLNRMLEAEIFKRYPNYASLLRDVEEAIHELKVRRGEIKVQEESKAPKIILTLVVGTVVLAVLAGIALFTVDHIKTKRQEAERQRKLDADLAAGRVVKRLVDGKIQYVNVTAAAEAPAAGASAVAPAPKRRTAWDLVPVADTAVSGEATAADMRDRTVLLLRGGTGALSAASKIYLRYSLKEVDRDSLEKASLRLTVGRKTANKAKANNYQLNLWALKEPAAWDEYVEWHNAPGNDRASTGQMDAGKAELLETIDLPANPETGDPIRMDSAKLLQFIKNYASDDLTLVITADTEYDHRSGWRITASEDDRFRPPTLMLQTK